MDDRSKRALVLGGAAVTLFVLVQYFWLPMLSRIERLEKQVAMKRYEELPQVKQEVEVIESLLGQQRLKSDKTSIDSLLPWLEEQIRAFKFDEYVERIEPNNQRNNSLREVADVRLSGIAMEQLMPFLVKLNEFSELVVLSAVIREANKGGVQFSMSVGVN